ncbi:MAG: hypothetical protein IPM39_25475 [Chloroflexi bacterium]|nr:hypothetical protein [Chloroflexota bacterium]
MNLNNLANIATIIEALFVIISVVFIWRELRENTKLSRTANSQSLVELSSPFNMQLIQDRQMAELWVLGSEKYDNMDVVDKYRYKSLLVWWLILHENIFYQKQNDLLDSAIYAAWASDLKDFVKQQNLTRLWDELKGNFQSEFVERVTELIEEHKTDLR